MVLNNYARLVALCLFLSLGSQVAAAATETYIITLKPNAKLDWHVTERREGFELKHVYSSVLNGYAAALSPAALKALKASDDVLYIEKDQIVSIDDSVKRSSGIEAQLGGSSRAQLEKKAAGGAGVDIYFIDTGITVSKSCFGGRATWGASFGGYGDADGSGHGTAMAASALCSSTGGTATSANGIAVKVLSDSGSGTTAAVISGMNWVVAQHQATGRPSIAVMGIGGGASAAVDSAVTAAVAAGVSVVVTAGFNALNVNTASPARVASAVTVGSLPRTKAYPSNSNYGAGLDVWSFYPTTCPTEIPGCNTPTNAVSYVAAYIAVAISQYGNQTPAALEVDLKSHAVPDVTGVPSGTTSLRAVPW
ncbi:subtilisin-like protein [Ceratobasidium sp. AG-I]|nr:subtilisin-like protein [Ceratobasidium sp. AG-I]